MLWKKTFVPCVSDSATDIIQFIHLMFHMSLCPIMYLWLKKKSAFRIVFSCMEISLQEMYCVIFLIIMNKYIILLSYFYWYLPYSDQHLPQLIWHIWYMLWMFTDIYTPRLVVCHEQSAMLLDSRYSNKRPSNVSWCHT